MEELRMKSQELAENVVSFAEELLAHNEQDIDACIKIVTEQMEYIKNPKIIKLYETEDKGFNAVRILFLECVIHDLEKRRPTSLVEAPSGSDSESEKY